MQEVTIIVPDRIAQSRGELVSNTERQLLDTNDLLQERIAALEFALEDEGWQLLNAFSDREFSRQGLQRIIKRSRLMWLSNPLIRRPVNVQANYVFGQGVEFEAEDPDVNALIQDFQDDPANRAEFSSHQERTAKEIELNVDGNVFFVYFTDPLSGRVTVRSIAVEEIQDIMTNPEDAKEPWFYLRVWMEQPLRGVAKEQKALYPHFRYKPQRRVPSINGIEIRWDNAVHHVKDGGLSKMKFGVPQTYPALDWAKAYKEALEDDATRSRALARFAMKLTIQGSAAAMAPAKEKLQTTYGSGQERNPPPGAASTFIARRDRQGNQLADMEPVKLDGTMLPTDHSRPFRLMVAAAVGLPETYFGDADVGNHATAKTMDRPTELQFLERRQLWTTVYNDQHDYVIRKAISSPGGRLRGMYKIDQDGKVVPIKKRAADNMTATVNVNWPPLLEHDLAEQVTAIVTAATLGGHNAQPILGIQTVARAILTVLGVKDIDEKITQWFGDAPDALPDPVAPPAPFGAPPPITESEMELRMRGLLAEALREAIREDAA